MYKKIGAPLKKPLPGRQDSEKFHGGLYYDPKYLRWADRQLILEWLQTLYPIWERRYSTSNPPPEGKTQRALLRPVYWLGNWQFACLNYYHPPKGTLNRCVVAEGYPPMLEKVVREAESIVRKFYPKRDIPVDWELNTCLINYYGRKLIDGKWKDTARVGEHKDFEPGPVASLSLGERALFQFVTSSGRTSPAQVTFQQWLDDGSLQIFGGTRWKEQCFHRVQRVDKKQKIEFPINVSDFKPRRINFTFRYVPREHFVPFSKLPLEKKADILEYMRELGKHSKFFARELGESLR